MPQIIVNATALETSGALTILKQFIEALPVAKCKYILFVSPNISIEHSKPNIWIVPVNDVKSFLKRFMWDIWGVKKWLKIQNIVPSASISLQNTNFCTGYKISNYIYYHQSIPFFSQKWSLFKEEERSMWFYKYIYPFFVNLFLNKRTEVFVQIEFIKDGFARRFNFPQNRIHVVRPKIDMPDRSKVVDVELESDKINLFYPATPFFYKNHKIIIEALLTIKNCKPVLYLTCDKGDLNIECDKMDIHFMGVVSFEKVLEMYAKADALLFPSYIETYGLPLIEAATFGIPILVADLPYSREVLNGYEGVEFIDYSDAQKWTASIEKLEKGKRYEPYTLPEVKSWSELFRILTQSL